ncbi:hypothetical protein MKX03_008410, partial [Papaver bracteatum]
MVNLPRDIVSDILVRLPVKSIARFRCVNKVWCKFLKNPEFLKTQYKYAVEMNRFSIMVRNGRDIYTFSYDPSSSTFWSSGHIKYPVNFFAMGIEIFGWCNGLVLLRHYKKFKLHVLILWNPSTDEFKKLPDPPTRFKGCPKDSVEYGIGYDHQIEDFKVVCIAQEMNTNWYEVQVYTLRSNSWRRLQAIRVDMRLSTFNFPDMGRLAVNGALYWKALGENIHAEIILRFDFEKEEFDQIPIPDEVNHDNQVCLCVLGGSLWCLEYGGSLEFWELKENGVEKSWSHPITIDMHKFEYMDDLTPLRILENGKIMFGVHDGHASLCIVLYDPEHETTRTLNIYEGIAASSLPTSVYVESLISLGT